MTLSARPELPAPKEDATPPSSGTATPVADTGGQDQAGDEGALTCIRPTYTLATPHGPDSEEADAIVIRNFLETIAEIALSVASRTVKQ